MLQIAAVHGVNTGPQERRTFAESWERTLQAIGVPCEVTPCPWPSMDSGIKDSLRILWDPWFRDGAVVLVRNAIKDWVKETTGPRIVIAHSMGTPLALDALRDLRSPVPLLAIGSPMTHPIFGPRLELAGFGRAWNDRPQPPAITNRDDGICALRWLGQRFIRRPKGFRVVEVEVEVEAGGEPKGWVREHEAELYLRHPETIREMCGLL